ncbi:MAG: phosphoribosylaminoimidazolesuccinocarboxamide synthase [Abditibacteriales bacterium]|nr:phosphoribosylaminoimidazolesuccinocarboxamide synthase [Abditibacteriales bacterium]
MIHTESQALLQTQLGDLKPARRGKVRDIYDLGEHLLIVATDRLSAFDVVMPTGIPTRGIILTQLSLFWFDFVKDIVPNHLITADVAQFPPPLPDFADQLQGRSMLVKKAQVIPIECVVRGYLAGSGWKEYQKSQSVCGITLPSGLRESDRLPEPIFTPATKAETGHDENITQQRMFDLIGKELGETLMDLSLKIYQRACEYALSRGIIIADTKFEFGRSDGQVILVDEALTPDSSRFWDAATYQPGRSQDSFDKQFVRDYLETLDWNKEPPGPALPPDIVAKTLEKYREAYRRLVGQ